MVNRRLCFGPRYDADGINWVCENGSRADDRDVGFSASVDEDGQVRLSIGNKLFEDEWLLTPQQREEFVAFLQDSAALLGEKGHG